MKAKPIHDLEKIPRTTLKDRDGLSLVQFRKDLRPHYGKVAFDLGLGYLFLGLSLLLPMQITGKVPALLWAMVLLCAFFVGFWIAYLHLFMHEAAHYNLAPSRKWNDLLSDLLICIWSGQNTSAYRVIHWDHHRFLGTTKDTEHSYFNALTPRFLLESLTGIAALKVLLFREAKLKRSISFRERSMPLAAFLTNGTIVLSLYSLGHWPFALAWIVGLVAFFPFFGAIRQLLEHRRPDAALGTDFSKVRHEKYTRMFREGPFASFLGGAGFTRHLLHHWDPQISYTRLKDLEAFLAGTRWGPGIEAARTTYRETFRELFQW
jgi:fatty acid desaturase